MVEGHHRAADPPALPVQVMVRIKVQAGDCAEHQAHERAGTPTICSFRLLRAAASVLSGTRGVPNLAAPSCWDFCFLTSCMQAACSSTSCRVLLL